MAAYSGLHCVVPKDKPLDRAGARVMCGICHNLQGRQLYDTPPLSRWSWVGGNRRVGGGRLDLFRVLLVVKLDAVELVARRFERNKRLLRRPDLDRRLGRQVQAARGLERGELVRPRVVRRLSPVVREDYLHLRAEGRDVSS